MDDILNNIRVIFNGEIVDYPENIDRNSEDYAGSRFCLRSNIKDAVGNYVFEQDVVVKTYYRCNFLDKDWNKTKHTKRGVVIFTGNRFIIRYEDYTVEDLDYIDSNSIEVIGIFNSKEGE